MAAIDLEFVLSNIFPKTRKDLIAFPSILDNLLSENNKESSRYNYQLGELTGYLKAALQTLLENRQGDRKQIVDWQNELDKESNIENVVQVIQEMKNHSNLLK